MLRLATAILMLSLTFASAAHGHCLGEFKSWNVGFGLGQGFPDRPSLFSEAAEKDWHGGVWLRKNLCPHGGLEFNYNHLSYVGSGDPQTDLFSINLFHRLMHGPLTPVMALGLGLANEDRYSRFTNQIGMLARAGLEYSFIADLALGVNAQYTYIGSQGARSASEQYTWSYLIGLSYNFGALRGDAGKAAAALPPTSLPKVVVPVADTDNDGVNDDDDKCPGSPAGAKVNGYGCKEKEVAKVELNVLFATGKADVDPASKDQIQNFAKFMKEFPTTKVAIEGHTDNVGGAKTNLTLSQARANAVQKILIEQYGIAANRLSAKGFGSSKPVADNKTPEGREQNRRVMVNISNGR